MSPNKDEKHCNQTVYLLWCGMSLLTCALSRPNLAQLLVHHRLLHSHRCALLCRMHIRLLLPAQVKSYGPSLTFYSLNFSRALVVLPPAV